MWCETIDYSELGKWGFSVPPIWIYGSGKSSWAGNKALMEGQHEQWPSGSNRPFSCSRWRPLYRCEVKEKWQDHAQKGRLWTHLKPPVTTRLCIKSQLWLWQAQWMLGNVQAMLIQWLLKGEDGAMKKPTDLPTPQVINHCDQIPNPCCGRENIYSGRVRQALLSIRNTNNFCIT